MGWTLARLPTSRRTNTRGRLKSTPTVCLCFDRRMNMCFRRCVVVDLYTFIMSPAIAKYSTLAHRWQTKLFIDQWSFVAVKFEKPQPIGWVADWASGGRVASWHPFVIATNGLGWCGRDVLITLTGNQVFLYCSRGCVYRPSFNYTLVWCTVKTELEQNYILFNLLKHKFRSKYSTVWVKKSSPPKLFAVFSLPVNLYNWKLPWLLPKHIPMSIPILVHSSGYLCEMYHFYWCDPSNFKNSISFVTKFMNFP